jgi:hypothetical protein
LPSVVMGSSITTQAFNFVAREEATGAIKKAANYQVHFHALAIYFRSTVKTSQATKLFLKIHPPEPGCLE